MLSVPSDRRSRRDIYPEIRLEYTHPWQKKMVHTLSNAYSSAAYFEFYGPAIEATLLTRYTFLHELNGALIQVLCRLLELPYPPYLAAGQHVHLPAWCFSADFCPPGFQPPHYYQLFEPFYPNLSVLDLLMNYGPESRRILRQGWHIG
jgi:hypothetical protein